MVEEERRSRRSRAEERVSGVEARQRWPLQPRAPADETELPVRRSVCLSVYPAITPRNVNPLPATMAPPDAVHLAAAVFESCNTAETRTPEALAPVLQILQQLEADGGGSGELLLAQAARVCADASREGTDPSVCLCGCGAAANWPAVEGWRTPLGESGIVGLFQDVFSRVPGDRELGRHCLRLIGNSCADNGALLSLCCRSIYIYIYILYPTSDILF